MDDNEQDTEPTIVIFRYWQGDVIALFVDEPSDVRRWYNCESYMHIGQHGGANPHWIIMHSRPATTAEYAPLKKELESDPYNYKLIIRQRMTRTMIEERNRRWDAMRRIVEGKGGQT